MALEKITPCLWFDSEAEEAARFYVSVFQLLQAPVEHWQGRQRPRQVAAIVD